MRKIQWIFMSLSICFSAHAQQRQTYDISSFLPPVGWQNETTDFASSYVSTNSVTGSWCRATVYKSFSSTGNSVDDFNRDWAALIAKSFPDAVLPTPEATQEGGWTSQAGASKFRFNDQDAAAMLTSVTGYGVTLSVVVLMNSDEFMPAVEAFLGSMDLQKPTAGQNNSAQNQTTPPAKPQNNSLGNQGISISTTNFDDGWVAQPLNDWVRVVNPTFEVNLYYADDFAGSDLNGKVTPEDHYWSNWIAKRFTILNETRWERVTYPPIHYKEGDAVNKETGKTCFIAMDVYFSNGGATVILAISPAKDVFKQKFPTPRDLETMMGYNKFAVCEKDLLGTWEESSGSGVNMYNVNTGAYAGMNTASSAHKFIFKTNGLYESAHSGASGMVGSMQFYGQKYNGKLAITNWDVTLTKRFKDKTEIFWAQFEAVRGGRILRLVNKEYSGDKYVLVKTK